MNPHNFNLYPQGQDHTLLITGAEGNIEAKLHIPVNYTGQTVALVCHPHPLFAGNMDNKVAWALAKAFTAAGAATLRFNFRGVGQSQGKHDSGLGETEDTLFLAQWLQKQAPGSQLLLGGFSFGGFVAIKAAQSLTCSALVTVAPATQYLAATDNQQTCPWLLLHGLADDVIPYSQVEQWLLQHALTPQINTYAAAGHFFHGGLTPLQADIGNWLRNTLQ